MRQTIVGLFLGICLVLSSAGPAVAGPQETQILSTSTSTVANVYVQTDAGINLYHANLQGKLTLVNGSPFQPSGPGQTVVGTNGRFFVMLGAKNLHSYPVASNGAILKQASQINTQSYAASECGAPTNSSEFDHTGQRLYVLMRDNGDADCDAVQTYSISTGGHFVFRGDTLVPAGFNFYNGLPTTTGRGNLGYGGLFNLYDNDSCNSVLQLYRLDSQQVLQYSTVNAIGSLPPTPPVNGFFLWNTSVPPALATDGTNHVVLAMYPTNDGVCSDDNRVTGPVQLGSFTPNGNGSLYTTNTYKNMPLVDGWPMVMNISPSGEVLAAAVGTGIQFFHFHGSNPLTKFTGIIGASGYVTAMQWDHSNHLYAVNGASGKLHVYTVTTTNVTEAPGSPYSVGAKGLVVWPVS